MIINTLIQKMINANKPKYCFYENQRRYTDGNEVTVEVGGWVKNNGFEIKETAGKTTTGFTTKRQSVKIPIGVSVVKITVRTSGEDEGIYLNNTRLFIFDRSGGDCTVIVDVKPGDEIIWTMTDVHRNKLMVEQIS